MVKKQEEILIFVFILANRKFLQKMRKIASKII